MYHPDVLRLSPMESRTIRVTRPTHELLQALAAESRTTITAVVDEAVRELGRKRFWAGFNASCEALRAAPNVWADLHLEDAGWEATLADGLTELPLEQDG
jgi:hypothetical protein